MFSGCRWPYIGDGVVLANRTCSAKLRTLVAVDVEVGGLRVAGTQFRNSNTVAAGGLPVCDMSLI